METKGYLVIAGLIALVLMFLIPAIRTLLGYAIAFGVIGYIVYTRTQGGGD
jgi:hypothetical protein